MLCLPKVAAPGTIDTFLPPLELVPAEAAVIFAVLFLMSLSEGGVRSSLGYGNDGPRGQAINAARKIFCWVIKVSLE